MSDITQDALVALLNALKDPKKKALILEGILSQNNAKPKTPLKKIRTENCESPTALHRRRVLEQRKEANIDSASSSSESSAELVGPKVSQDKILKGVIAYVEVKFGGKMQSEGIKVVIESMGAIVREAFTRDVTHVIFKDGSFNTYQKAKLLKCHLVSVLWVDACKRNGGRVNEIQYRPFGPQSSDPEISLLCNKLQKDYEEVVKDEKRRSFSVPRFSKKFDKRKTLHAPSTSSLASLRQSQIRSPEPDPEITSDGSDCGIVDGHSFNHLKSLFNSTPTITDDDSLGTKSPDRRPQSSTKLNKSHQSFYDMVQPLSQINTTSSSNDSRSLISRKKLSKTINTPIDMDLTEAASCHNNNNSSTRKVLQEASGVSLLNTSLESDRTPSDLERKSLDKTSTTMSSLRVSYTNDNVFNKENTLKSTISSLRLSTQTTKSREGVDSPKTPIKSKKLTLEECLNDNSDVSSVPTSSNKNVTTRKKPPVASIRTVENVEENTVKKTPGKRKTNQPKKDKSTKTPRRTDKSSFTTMDSNLTTSPKSNEEPTTLQQFESDLLKQPKSAKTPRNNYIDSSNTTDSSFNSANKSKRQLKTPRARKVQEIGLSDSSSEISPSPKKIQRQNEQPKKNIRRKLYNPDDEMGFDLPDENAERAERLLAVKSPPNENFVNPNNVPKLTEKTPSLSAKKSRKTLSRTVSSITTDSNTTQSEDSELDSQSDMCLRRSQRLSVSQIIPKYKFSSSSDSTTNSDDLPIKRIERRSTLDFQNLTLSQKQRMFKSDHVSSIVCTKFHRHENEEFEIIVAKLGRFYTEHNVSDQTTHVVAGDCKRTLNILRGIARGCWILKRQWLLDSDKEGRWLPEEDYEMTEFSKAVQKCRLERQAFGPDFSMDIFKNCGNIYVAPKTNPPTKDLKNLIIMCKGTLTLQPHNAKISIGQVVGGETVSVSEMWVLDSITNNKLEKISKYLLEPTRQKSPEF